MASNDHNDSFREIVEALPTVIIRASPEGEAEYISSAWQKKTGQAVDTALGTGWMQCILGEDIGEVLDRLRVARRDRSLLSEKFRLHATGGKVQWARLDLAPLVNEDGIIERWHGTISEEPDPRSDARRTYFEQRLKLLIDIGSHLAHSEDILSSVGDTVATLKARFAPLIAVELLSGERHTRVISNNEKYMVTTNRDSAFLGIGRRFFQARGLTKSTNFTLAGFGDGELSEISADIAFIFQSSPVKVLATPILAPDGAYIGALICCRDAAALSFSVEDGTFAEEVARRLGAAANAAQRYQREHSVAEALQLASLALTLPPTEEYSFDAVYRAARVDASIGGDWYDAFAVGGHSIVITIGDVLGSGLDAAVTMTKLRQAMQGVGLLFADPNLILDAAHRTLLLQNEHGLATALACVIDCKTQELRYASAGHPGPLLRTNTGAIYELPSGGIMLGLRDEPSDVIVQPLRSGDMLVFYTDGLVESQRNFTAGLERLIVGMAKLTDEPRPAEALLHMLLPEGASDDTAILTVRVR